MKKKIFGIGSVVAIIVIILCLIQCEGVGVHLDKKKDSMTMLGAGETLASRKCDSSNKGEAVYVVDEGQAYVCDEDGWVPAKKAPQGVVAGVAAKDTSSSEEERQKAENGNGNDGQNQESGKEKKEGCSGKVVSGENLSGIEINCDGAPVDTVKKEPNEFLGPEGAECEVKSDSTGKTSVKCPAGDSTEVQKCGKDVYDPKGDKFCANDTLQEKCNGKEYDVKTKVCEKGVITEAKKVCGGAVYDATKQFCDTRDNHVYKYVKIGKGAAAQTWMAENLVFSVNPGSQSWCGGTYGSVEGNCEAYGRLYTWAAAVGKSERSCGYDHRCSIKLPVQGACPVDWHLPTRGEWEALIANVGGKPTAGKMLKSVNGWSNDSRGTDSFLFSALSGGYRTNDGIFFGAGDDADFWSATEDGATNAYNMYIGNQTPESYIFDYEKNFAFSVRCVKNK